MANIKSQIKRNRQNLKRQLRNKSVRAEIKTRVKSAMKAAEAEKTGTATAKDDSAPASVEALRMAVKRIDKAAALGVIHPNQASNRKSALMRKVAALTGGSRAG